MVNCSALNCRTATSGVYKDSTVSFYSFPLRNIPLLRQWLHNMGRDMGMPSRHQRLCSKHFEEDSFGLDPFNVRKNRRLLREAVPRKFILGKDGKWLVGTPQSGIGNKTQKHTWNPEHSRVPGTFDNAAAREGKNLEDWQKEPYKNVTKENYGSLTMSGEDPPVPKSNIQARAVLHVRDQQDFEDRGVPPGLGPGTVIRSELQSQAKSADLRGAGGSRDLACQISNKEVTSESHWDSAAQANPRGRRRGNSSPEEGEPDEIQEILFYQQTQTGERVYLCTECQKTFKLKIGLLKHKQIHTEKNQVPSYICTGCGESFSRYADVIRHQKFHTMGERPYKCTECEKSFREKPRLTNHLRVHNIYM